MTSIHEPTPEFERFLEWQVTSALRRRDRFAAPAPPGPRKYLSAATVVVVSLLIGAAAGAAPGRIQDNQQKSRLLQLQEGELQVAQMQIALAEKAAQTVKRRADVGVAGQDEVAAAERDLQAAALHLQRVQVNIDEVQQSGRAVQDDVTSPLVRGRDYVVQRLNLDQKAATMAAAAAERQMREARRRNEAGVGTELELAKAQADLVRAAADMRSVGERLALRQQFIAGTVTAQAATLRRLLIAARAELDTATSELEVLSKRHAVLETQFKIGTADEVDVLKAQLEMLSRKQDVDRLRARIAALEQGRNQ